MTTIIPTTHELGEFEGDPRVSQVAPDCYRAGYAGRVWWLNQVVPEVPARWLAMRADRFIAESEDLATALKALLGAPRRGVRVDPAAAAHRSAEHTEVPRVYIAPAAGAARTCLVVRFADVAIELEFEPGQVDTLTAALLDESPVPYEWPLNGSAPAVWVDDPAPGGFVCAAADPRGRGGICGMPVESEPCPEHSGCDLEGR